MVTLHYAITILYMFFQLFCFGGKDYNYISNNIDNILLILAISNLSVTTMK